MIIVLFIIYVKQLGIYFHYYDDQVFLFSFNFGNSLCTYLKPTEYLVYEQYILLIYAEVLL